MWELNAELGYGRYTATSLALHVKRMKADSASMLISVPKGKKGKTEQWEVVVRKVPRTIEIGDSHGRSKDAKKCGPWGVAG